MNDIWERHIKNEGAEFVQFVDVTMLPEDITDGCGCAILFGRTLSEEYIDAIRTERKPRTKEVFNTERKMDELAVRIADRLNAEGHRSIGKFKTGLLPHKTIARIAGLGFIGKNNLLITDRYGCALMLGKVLTTAPFVTGNGEPQEPRCGNCKICVDVCPTGALLGRAWSISTTRDDIMNRRLCTLCLKCMVFCPYTAEFMEYVHLSNEYQKK